MFEARLAASVTLKKILDAIKDLVNQANFDCSADGISLQVRRLVLFLAPRKLEWYNNMRETR